MTRLSAVSGLHAWQICGFVLAAGSIGVGQLLFKLAAAKLATDRGAMGFMASLLSWPALVAIALYGATTLLWIYLLRDVALSRAYPFMALPFALVPGASWLLFGEAISWRYLLGLGIVLLGLYVIVAAEPPA
jgi:drug/metabolite transporter (DMT)-like permease